MDRERGSPCPSGSRRRPSRRSRPGTSLVQGWGAVLAVLLLVPGTAAASTAGSSTPATTGTPPRPSAAAAGAEAAAPLILLDQTSSVTGDGPFVLRLRPGRGTPAAAQLGVSVAVYPCLSSVSGFNQSVEAPPSGNPISSTTAPLPVSGLPGAAGGAFTLSLPVRVDNAETSPPGGFIIDLASVPEQCGLYPAGVYPVRIDLVNTTTHQTVGGITTHLIYTDAPADTKKLRFALVLPIRTQVVAAPDPTTGQLQTRPATALAQPTPAQVDAVVDTVAAVDHQPAVPITIDATAQTIGVLQSSGHQATVNQLSALAADPSVHQFASAPFAPVDASSLVNAGLDGELATQVARGTALVSHEVTHLPVVPNRQGVWVSERGLDPATLAQLQSDGYSKAIVPSGSVSSAPTDGSTAQPFTLSTSTGRTMAAFASSLSARFAGPAGNPVLAAHQLVAELAQIYYEQPNDDTARAIVAVPPTTWPDDPAFVSALLGALHGNPIIQSVIASNLFATFTDAAGCRGPCRSLSGGGTGGLPAAAIRTQRQRVNSFATAAPTAHNLIVPLGDLVLAGESDLLRPGQQAAVLDNTGSAVDAQLKQLVVAGGQSITLTSQQGRLPIDIVSSAPYPVTATLTVTSDKLLFANGTTGWTQPTTVLPGHSHTDVVYVNVRARTSGVFTVAITLHSPSGGLQLSSGQIVVRSTATSIVGIILSLGAIAVLAVWWVRTSRKRRARRRAEETGASGVPAEVR